MKKKSHEQTHGKQIQNTRWKKKSREQTQPPSTVNHHAPRLDRDLSFGRVEEFRESKRSFGRAERAEVFRESRGENEMKREKEIGWNKISGKKKA